MKNPIPVLLLMGAMLILISPLAACDPMPIETVTSTTTTTDTPIQMSTHMPKPEITHTPTSTPTVPNIMPTLPEPTPTPTISCDKLLEAELSENCKALGSNDVCYGNHSVYADFIWQVVRFEVPGDIASVYALRSIQAQGAGTAIMMIEGDLTGFEDEGQVYVCIYGNVDFDIQESVVNAKGNACEDLRSGMIIKTPRGVCKRITINGVEIELSSTAWITLRDDNTWMTIANREGKVSVTSGEVSVNVPEGRQIDVKLKSDKPISISTASSPMILSDVEEEALSLVATAFPTPTPTKTPTSLSTPSATATIISDLPTPTP